jgi:hypothetical protein
MSKFGKNSPTKRKSRRGALPLAQIKTRPVGPGGGGPDAGTGPTTTTITSPPTVTNTGPTTTVSPPRPSTAARQSVSFGRPPAPTGGPLTLPAVQTSPLQAPGRGAKNMAKDWMALSGLGIKTKGKMRPNAMKDIRIERDLDKPLDLAGVTKDNATLAMIGRMVKPEHASKAELAVNALHAAGEPAMSINQLVARVDRLGDIYDRVGPDTTGALDRDTRIALDMYDTQQARDLLSSVVQAERVDHLPAGQARAVYEFMRDNPGLKDVLDAGGLTYKFDSRTAKLHGDGVFIDGVIHLGALNLETPGVFLRLLLHETGHATYQRSILPPDEFPEGKLPAFWDKGEAPDAYREREELLEEAEELGLSPTDQPYAAKIAAIDADLAKNDAESVWAKMPEDTKTLYQAWTWLRTEGGRHLLGLDLGGTNRHEADRLDYQAKTFTEFCAETFMQAATGDLNAHLIKVMNDPNASAEIQEAWMNTARVLDKHAEQGIFGRPTAFDRT